MNQYTDSFKSEVLADWEYNITTDVPPYNRSMREFCAEWDIPRATFQGWLNRSQPLPADRFYAPPAVPTEPITNEALNNDTVLHVLRMIAKELTSVSEDLNAIVNRL